MSAADETTAYERRSIALIRVGMIVAQARLIDDAELAALLAVAPAHWCYRPVVEAVLDFRAKVFVSP